jgi:hypothetical protein
MRQLTPAQFLAELRQRGARALERVRFRENRSTLWSLTSGDRVLNLQAGYAIEPAPDLLDAFARLLQDPGGRTRLGRDARTAVRRHPHLAAALQRAELRVAASPRRGRRTRSGPNCATPAQQFYLERLYALLNRERFDGALPPAGALHSADALPASKSSPNRALGIPLRLSNAARRTLGWVIPEKREDGTRAIRELVLAAELMLERNDALRLDTMIHEMAHVAAWIRDGDPGHGRAWKRWARKAGCEPRRCTAEPIARRRNRGVPITRVPPLATQYSLF